VDISFRLDDTDDPIREPGANLRSIVVGRCRSSIRRRRMMQQHPPPPPSDLPPSAELLWDVLQRLSADQRIVVVLKYYGGYRASEIARSIEQPAATVRSHLRRALATMRKELTR
jgi:DNA-directed RNA polymerase specialized sigma24 family protein